MPRPPLDKERFDVNVSSGTTARIKELAKALGYTYAGEGSQGKLLDAIAHGEVLLVQPKK